MPAVVGRLADALGWPVGWSDTAKAEIPPGKRFAIANGEERLGTILVEAPDDGRLMATYDAACEVAEVVAELLNRVIASSHTARSRSRDVSALVAAVKDLPRTTDLQSAVGHLLRITTQLTGLWTAAFFLFDPRCERLRLRATHQLPAKTVPHAVRDCSVDSPDGLALRDGSAMLNHLRPGDGEWLPANMAIGIGVPILADGCVIGSLWCYDRRQRELNTWEAEVLQSAAAQLSAVLERTMLQQESRRQQALTSEIEFAARKVPAALVAPLPAECGLEIAVRAATVTGVGGDFCDVIPLGNRRTLIAIGDAVGHSVPAAMLVSVARGALRALVGQTPDRELTPELLTVGVNRALQTVTRSEQFVTLFVGIIDSGSATLTYTNAGHPPPLLYRNWEWSSLNTHGMFLGFRDAAYAASTLSLAAGDALACFTDGVTETINREQVPFRRGGIADNIPGGPTATAEAIAETIWQRVIAHDPDRPLRDDRTLLVVKWV